MALKNNDVKRITGLRNDQIVRYLYNEGIISKESKGCFKFNDNTMDENFLVHTIRDDEKVTLWKYEAEKYLINISEKCRIQFYPDIATSLVLASSLPFTRGEKYLVKIKKMGKRYMLIESDLGLFLTNILVNRKLLEVGKTYIMIMGETKTKMQEIHNAR